ncbi:MAG TPA: FRG domain-containing protein [Planctomycetaceae bacterium]
MGVERGAVERAEGPDEHGWHRITPRSPEELFELAASLSARDTDDRLIHRGQAGEDWTLKTRLARAVEEWRGEPDFESLIALEERLLGSFQKRAHLFLPETYLPPPDRPLAWMALMQHHGCPTRLLDWTRSFYVALYIAVSDYPDKDGLVWVLRPTLLAQTRPPIENPSVLDFDEEAFREHCCREPGMRWVSTLSPSLLSDRMHAQQGLFLFSNDPTADLVDLPADDSGGGEPDRIKVVIGRDLKPAVRQVLLRMNLTAAALFPGIDGLGRLLREIAETDAAYD